MPTGARESAPDVRPVALGGRAGFDVALRVLFQDGVFTSLSEVEARTGILVLYCTKLSPSTQVSRVLVFGYLEHPGQSESAPPAEAAPRAAAGKDKGMGCLSIPL
jgi:hypothetical protein